MPCNPSDVQVDVLLEAQRSICLRLTRIEEAMERLAESASLQERSVSRILRVLRAEIDAIKQVMVGEASPRRCPNCFDAVSVYVHECPGCKQPLA